MLEQIEPSRLPYEWEQAVVSRNGWAAAFAVPGTDAAILVSVGKTKDSDRLALWVEGLRGSLGMRPKENAERARATIGQLAEIGHRIGCAELRVEANSRLGWKTALLTKLGFELSRVGDGSVMRKAI